MAEYTTKPENMSDEQWTEYQKNNAYVQEGLNPMDRAIPGAGTYTEWNRGTNPYAQGTRYYDLWESNPYRTASSKRTFWDDVANAFGFRSSWDIADEQRIQAGKEYDAQIAQLKTEDEYNSPEQQAERMRAAGMNPDLLGTEGVSQAGEFAQEQTSPDYSGKEQVGKAVQFVGALTQVISTGVNMTTGVASALGLFEELKSKSYSNADKLIDLAEKFVGNFAPNPSAGQSPEQQAEFMYKYAGDWADRNHIKGKNKKVFMDNVSSFYAWHKASIYDRDSKNQEAKKEWGRITNSKYTTQAEDNEEILRITGEGVDAIDKAEMDNIKAKAAEAKYNREYQERRNGAQAAEAENKENESRTKVAEFSITAKQAVDTMVEKLEPYVKKGNLFALTLQSALPGLYLKYLK